MDWKNRIFNIINKIKFQLHAIKVDNLNGVRKIFNEIDKDQNGFLDKEEFKNLLSRLGIFLTTQEFRIFFETFDINHDGKISYKEFISYISTDMSDKRLQAVKFAYSFLDKQGTNNVPLDFLRDAFISEEHPRVLTRQKTNNQVENEIFDVLFSKRLKYFIQKEFLSLLSKNGQTITENDFIEFYQDISACHPVEKEEYFVDMVIKTWGLTKGRDYVSPARVQDLEIIIFEKIRQKTLAKEDEGKTLFKVFKYFDVNNQGVVTLSQFSEALAQFGCNFTNVELQALFSKFDVNNTGKIAYDEFSNLIALIGSGTNANVNPVFQLNRQPPSSILSLIRKTLLAKFKYNALTTLQDIFKKADKNKNGNLDRNEFVWALLECGLKFSKTEIDNIFKYFDKNCDNVIMYPEFIEALVGDLNEKRKIGLMKIFKKIDRQEQGKVSKEELLSNFNASKYQQNNIIQVINNKLSQQEVQEQFQQYWGNFEYISFIDFANYHRFLSIFFEFDKDFIEQINSLWDI